MTKIEEAPEREPMRIVRLVAERFKRLSAVDITPDGYVVEITGPNGAGKSSVLEAIWTALGGSNKSMAELVNDDGNSAEIYVDLGEIRVTKKIEIRERGAEPHITLVVQDREGRRLAQPQSVLKMLYDAVAFSPEAMITMTDEERFQMVRSFVPDFDFAAADRTIASLKMERRDFERDRSRAAAAVAAIDATRASRGINTPAKSVVRVDTAALSERLAGAIAMNTELAAKRNAAIETIKEIDELRRHAAHDRREAAALTERAAQREAYAAEMEAKAKSPDDYQPIDYSDIQAEMAAASERNREADIAEERQRLADTERSLSGKVEEFERRIAETEAQKVAALANAKLPIDGLTLVDGVVHYQGHPFSRISKAEKIRVSFALGAARRGRMAVALISDGAVIDQESFKLIAAEAARLGIQVWIETVDSERPGAIVIEDGHVKT